MTQKAPQESTPPTFGKKKGKETTKKKQEKDTGKADRKTENKHNFKKKKAVSNTICAQETYIHTHIHKCTYTYGNISIQRKKMETIRKRRQDKKTNI